MFASNQLCFHVQILETAFIQHLWATEAHPPHRYIDSSKMQLRPQALIFLLLTLSAVSGYVQLCKCVCGTNSTVFPLLGPAGEELACNNCTKNFCIEKSDHCINNEDVLISTACFRKY